MKRVSLIFVLSVLFVGSVIPIEIGYQGPSDERFARGFPKTFFKAPLFLLAGSILFKLSNDSFQYPATNNLHRLYSLSTLGGSLYCFFKCLHHGVIGAVLMYGYDVEKPPESLKEVSKNNYEAPPEDFDKNNQQEFINDAPEDVGDDKPESKLSQEPRPIRKLFRKKFETLKESFDGSFDRLRTGLRTRFKKCFRREG